ncbi:hypothetical protein C1H46_009743 [Malus baccata]|uniref:Uncharacterized protein n=1 Tax=Malus baccata TaxID=106549 RepID=A0A540N2B1_MALBA|nr:hypothetical protein C1H46_009743 [Malus baccata]
MPPDALAPSFSEILCTQRLEHHRFVKPSVLKLNFIAFLDELVCSKFQIENYFHLGKCIQLQTLYN